MEGTIRTERSARSRETITQFIERSLGRGGRAQSRSWFMGTFGARFFAEFWRCWNPVYGYALYYWSYRPLRRILPRAAAGCVLAATALHV